MSSQMKIGIAGAGAIAMGYAAYLLEKGRAVSIWSPTGNSTSGLKKGEKLSVSGALQGEFSPSISPDAQTLAADNDVIILALPAYGHRAVLDALAPHIEPRHCVIISGHLSFAALYLSKKLAERGVEIPIAVWNTTALTAKAPDSPINVRIGQIRPKIDMAVVPVRLAGAAMEICISLFGDRFTLKDDMLSIALSNLNPQSHLGIALFNLTRIEMAETWHQNSTITPAVGRFLEALDAERIAIATALGKTVRTAFDMFTPAFEIEGKSLAELYQMRAQAGTDPQGPKSVETRYVLEDVPFGLTVTLKLADMAGVPAPLHRSGVEILSACYGRDFASANDLLPALGDLTLDDLSRLVVEGYSPA